MTQAMEKTQKEELTEKRRAILEAFDEDSTRPYTEIADRAGELLPGDETVSPYYASLTVQRYRFVD